MKMAILISLSCLALIVLGAEIGFSFKSMKPFDFGPTKWVHHLGMPANTLKGLQKTLDQGYIGLECDVHYDVETDKLIVTHDWPATTGAPELEDIFKALPSNRKLWIDYKNAELSSLSRFAERLRELEAKYNLQDRFFIESPNLFHQILLSWSGINTVYWLQIHSKSRISFLREFLSKAGILAGNFIAISYPIEARTSKMIETFGKLEQLVFTVNDRETYERLQKDVKVRAIITDI